MRADCVQGTVRDGGAPKKLTHASTHAFIQKYLSKHTHSTRMRGSTGQKVQQLKDKIKFKERQRVEEKEISGPVHSPNIAAEGADR